MSRKKKLINVNEELWNLLNVFAKWKKLDLPNALEYILSKHLLPIKKALEGIEE